MKNIINEEFRLLKARAVDLYKGWSGNQTQFSLETGWSTNYEEIFSGNFSRVLSENTILDNVLQQGRAILIGRGGDGKTWLLRRLYRQALDRGDMPVLLDLKQWTSADYDEWKTWTSREIGDAADFIVRRFSNIGIGAIELDRVPPTVRKILLVDGLNEITSSVGAQILSLLDELVRDQINLSVLVADRMIRRDLPNPSRWAIGAVRPLSASQVRKYLGKKNGVEVSGILTSPFFLDAALRYRVEGHSRSQASERFLLAHGGVKEQDLDQIGSAAFDAYRHSRSRVFDRSRFATLAGEISTISLENSETLLIATEDKRYFLHHILHDYLAARHFAKRPSDEWTPQALSELSFDGSSFDAIELVFEQLNEESADQFLLRLYDWNLYAAGYALGQARDSDSHVGIETRTMIFAMLAEKRFDAILATAQKANDALALMQLSDARFYYEAPSLEAVFAALDAVQSNEKWFIEWRRLFQTRPDVGLPVERLATIQSANSITGWTVANVAKRVALSSDCLNSLVQWIHSNNATGRWRIAHVLGSYATPIVLKALLQLLDFDDDTYVRYGAVRSIVELAAKSDSALRKEVSAAIEKRAKAISEQPKISGELRTCLLMDVDASPNDWLSFVEDVVRAMFLAIDPVSERDLWRRCLMQAEILSENKKRKSVQSTARGT
jgi:GTPase SAR1 family protein